MMRFFVSFFFFFKQKTAYEMRISDWSSDVCSSDLLMEDIDMYELLQRGPQNKLEELRIDLYQKVNALGIGAQGLGGLTTVLDVKINTFPTHAASKPVAMIPNCAATRHVHFELDEIGRAPV